jgi:hypothetical protein
MIAMVAVAAPWAFAAVLAYPASKRGFDALILGAPSPLYSLVMVRAIERGEPHMQLTAGLGCSLGWAALGLLLFAVAARRATRTVAARREGDAELARRMTPSTPPFQPAPPSGAAATET